MTPQQNSSKGPQVSAMLLIIDVSPQRPVSLTFNREGRERYEGNFSWFGFCEVCEDIERRRYPYHVDSDVRILACERNE